MIKNNLHKDFKKSIQRNIMAAALCPLLAMSTSVAVLAYHVRAYKVE